LLAHGRNHFFSAGGVVLEGDAGAAGLAAGAVGVAGGVDETAGGAVVLAGGTVELAGGAVVPAGGAVEFVGGVSGSEAGVPGAFDLPSTSPWCFDQKSAIKQNTIQIEAVTIVMRVKISPAFAPNALEPPMPPSAPAKPPPRPRCTSTRRTRKIANRDRIVAMSPLMVLSNRRLGVDQTF
jgi:hypothetical protein